jgi:hypothetical protein
MEATLPLVWSHRPEPDLIGVSVFYNQKHFSLRFHLRTCHLEKLQNPKTLGIHGSAQNGFILTPDSEPGIKPSQVGKSDLFYVMQTLNKFDISKRERRTVWMRPEFENDRLRVPPLPPAWIAVESEFKPRNEEAGEEDKAKMERECPMEIGSENWPTSSPPTVPPPKPPSSSYQLPTDTDLARLQMELGQKLEEARNLIQQMERLSGLRLVLDRNLRLVINLTRR